MRRMTSAAVLEQLPAWATTGGAAALRALLAGGTRVAWGIVAPHLPATDAAAPRLLEAAVHATGATGAQSLLTPTCGTGQVRPWRELAVAEAVARLRA
jgi:hypothetical protein